MSFIFATQGGEGIYDTSAGTLQYNTIDGKETLTLYQRIITCYFDEQNEIWASVWLCRHAARGDSSKIAFAIAGTTDGVGVTYDTGNITINDTQVASGLEFANGYAVPLMMHVKSGVNNGIVEVVINGETVYSAENINVIHGELIKRVIIAPWDTNSSSPLGGSTSLIVATHKIPCGLQLRKISADISDLNGWTNTDGTLTSDTVDSTFSITPNASELDAIKATEKVYGVVPVFTGAASANITKLSLDSGGEVTLTTSSTTQLGEVVESDSRKITVTAKG